jgi:hypothetical protein
MMRATMSKLATAVVVARIAAAAALAGSAGSAASGCKAEQPAIPATPDGGGTLPGTGGPAGNLAAPSATVPAQTPLDTAPVRGSAPGATTVVVQGGGATSAVGLVLPDGSFCVDVPLTAGATNPLRVVTLSQGRMSEPLLLNVVQDAAAAVPAPASCAPPPGATPSCSDSQAACDPACNGCKEDQYQPNFFPNQAPALNMKTTYAGLQLCPCRADWFTFVAYASQSVKITATYAKTSSFDLDIAVYHGADVLPTISSTTSVAASTAGTSGANATRTIAFSVPSGGAYYLRIAALGANAAGSYTLTTQ